MTQEIKDAILRYSLSDAHALIEKRIFTETRYMQDYYYANFIDDAYCWANHENMVIATLQFPEKFIVYAGIAGEPRDNVREAEHESLAAAICLAICEVLITKGE